MIDFKNYLMWITVKIEKSSDNSLKVTLLELNMVTYAVDEDDALIAVEEAIECYKIMSSNELKNVYNEKDKTDKT